MSPVISSSQAATNKLKDRFPKLSVTLVSNAVPQVALAPSSDLSSPQSQALQNITTLGEMFPLLPGSVIETVLLHCDGQVSIAIDFLLLNDLLDTEMIQQESTNRPLCTLWVTGRCSGARAAACHDRHFYNEEDSPAFVVEGGSQNRQRQMKVFSSPYKARVVMEKVKVHKEEVNLDSGKEMKWLEVQERELIDLTGDVMEDLITHKDINDIKKIVNSPKDVDLQSSEIISSSPNHLEKRKLV